jgi:hypothetical protein
MEPLARHHNLLVETVGDELVLYDQDRDRAHALNRTAALVWRHCDGQRTIAELAALLRDELGTPVDEYLVWLALDQLGKKHLLQERVSQLPGLGYATRRDILKKVGRTAAIALLVPTITSIVAPTPAMAQNIPGCRYRPCGSCDLPDQSGGGVLHCLTEDSFPFCEPTRCRPPR